MSLSQGAYCAQCALMGHFQSECTYKPRAPKEAVKAVKPTCGKSRYVLRDDPHTFRIFQQAHGFPTVRIREDATPAQRRKVEEKMKKDIVEYASKNSFEIVWEPTDWSVLKKVPKKKKDEET